jgi:LAS superfamily LD-carboxypeptidase LdcB
VKTYIAHPVIKIIIIGSIILLGIVIVGGYQYDQLRQEHTAQEARIKELDEALKNTSDSLIKSQNEYLALMNALESERAKSSQFANQIDNITHQVEAYERLSQLDPELLKKYSKVYFLNENYTPSALTEIDTKYLFAKNKPLQFHDRAWPFLRNMLEAANQAGVNLQVASAYRSFTTQAQLKSTYRVTYGAGTANQFSADQGYSEHQLGTTIDFTTPTVGASFAGFDKTTAFNWLKDNAYRYGFVLSYPAGNKYYVYEPWHWRFVGIELANKVHNENKIFYDLDQREIDSYLGHIFLESL